MAKEEFYEDYKQLSQLQQEKEFLKKYNCSTLFEFIDVCLDFKLSAKILENYFELQQENELLNVKLNKFKYYEEANDVLLKENKKLQQLKITIGDWECNKSPIGRCIYDKNDVAQDNCLCCHQPDERK